MKRTGEAPPSNLPLLRAILELHRPLIRQRRPRNEDKQGVVQAKTQGAKEKRSFERTNNGARWEAPASLDCHVSISKASL